MPTNRDEPPSDELMVRFIELDRGAHGVEPICAVMPVVPSIYYEWKARERDATRRFARARWDAVLLPIVRRVWEATRRRYGAKKVWTELRRASRSSRHH